MKSKRTFLRGILLGTVAMAASFFGGGGVKPAAARDGHDLEGTWTFMVNVTGLPPEFSLGYTSLITFTRDGGVVQTAWVPPGTPATPVTGVSPWIGHGEWAQAGKEHFVLTVLIPRFDSSGNFVGLGKARSNIQLDRTRREASGIFAGDLFDADGNPVVTGFGGTVHAIRIEVEGP